MNQDKAKQKGFVLWLTGLSGAGKSTLAEILYEKIAATGHRCEQLDGDILRGYFPSTGFSKEARDEHIRRVGFMASRLEHHGVAVVASFISPYREAREFIRGLCENFIEVHISTSLDECKRRDVKGLYKKALAGEIKEFTGIDDPYEEPENAEIDVNTGRQTIDESVTQIMEYLKPYL